MILSVSQILTRDSVTVSVDAVVYFRVFDATLAVLNVMDASLATKLLAQTTLRNLLGTMSLADILTQREHVSTQMQVRTAGKWKRSDDEGVGVVVVVVKKWWWW